MWKHDRAPVVLHKGPSPPTPKQKLVENLESKAKPERIFFFIKTIHLVYNLPFSILVCLNAGAFLNELEGLKELLTGLTGFLDCLISICSDFWRRGFI